MTVVALFGAFLIAVSSPSDPAFQTDAGQQSLPSHGQEQDEPVHLEDIVVTGRPLRSLVQDFVSEVAEPNGYRGLARWQDRVCIGVANLRRDAAQEISDRVSDAARDVGLSAGEIGCTPNILVVATDDAETLTKTLAAERPRAFRLGASGMDRGRNAFNDFVQSDRPIRWWQQAMPVDSETGLRAVRLAGECLPPCNSTLDYAPQVPVDGASRIRTQIVDRLFRTVVVIDWEKVAHLSLMQLADYIAMITLAQIDPDADTASYASILNVLDDSFAAQQMTSWDKAYLSGLYSAEQNRTNRRTNRGEIAKSILRAHARLRSANVAEQTQH